METKSRQSEIPWTLAYNLLAEINETSALITELAKELSALQDVLKSEKWRIQKIKLDRMVYISFSLAMLMRLQILRVMDMRKITHNDNFCAGTPETYTLKIQDLSANIATIRSLPHT